MFDSKADIRSNNNFDITEIKLFCLKIVAVFTTLYPRNTAKLLHTINFLQSKQPDNIQINFFYFIN